jgi:hypothetical protein
VTSSLKTFEKIDEFSTEISRDTNLGRPLNVVEGLKFVKQAYYDNDSLSYAVPTQFDMPFLAPYLKAKPGTNDGNTGMNKLLNGFIDSTKRYTRISVNMKDVGSIRLPIILDTLQQKANKIFDTTSYDVQLTGPSVTFLEGSCFYSKWFKRKYFLGLHAYSTFNAILI